MKKRILRTMIVVFAFCVVLLSFNKDAYAAVKGQRIYGNDRIETAIRVSENGWGNGADTVVIAQGYVFADALCAAPLAGKYNAPVLLSDRDRLTEGTINELKRLKVKKIFIIGGNGAISENVEAQIKNAGISDIQRLAGQDRYQTSVKVAEYMGKPDGIVIASGNSYADSLSIAPIAAKLKMPVVLTEKDNLPAEVQSYVGGAGASKYYIIGGSGVISDSIKGSLVGSVRLGGSNRYNTNLAILQYFRDYIDFSNVFIAAGDGANGDEFADGLSVSALAAQKSAPVVLAYNSMSAKIASFIKSEISADSKITALGGPMVIPSAISDGLIDLYNDKTPSAGIEAIAQNSADVTVRIEGADLPVVTEIPLNVECFDMKEYGVKSQTGKANVLNALIDALKASGIDSKDKNELEISKSNFGNFVKTIAGISISGNGGWMYCVNNISPADSMENHEIKSGDSIVIYYVKDFSTVYSFFDKQKVSVAQGDEVKLNLKGIFYDESYNVSNKAIAGAKIKVNNQDAIIDGKQVVTDSSGNFVLKFTNPGIYNISASQTDVTGKISLSKPYCKVVVAGKSQLKDYSVSVQQIINKISEKTVISDWTTMELCRAGKKVPDGYADSVKKYMDDNKDSMIVTDYARMILGLSAAGVSPENFNGSNLIEKIYNNEGMDTPNTYIYGLLALNSGKYNIPADAKWTREKLVQAVLNCRTKDGGWDYAKAAADPDMTAVALSSLAPYYNINSDVRAAIDRAVKLLSDMQTINGGYKSWGTENSNSAAMVVTALCDLGIDPVSDSRFIKNGRSLMDALLDYSIDDSSGFGFLDNKSINELSTEQGLRALVSYKLFKDGKGSVYGRY